MSDSPLTVGPDFMVCEALQLMLKERIRHLPTLDEDGEVVGLIGDADVRSVLPDARRQPEEYERVASKVRVRDVMVRNPFCIQADASVLEAVDHFLERRLTVMPVVDERKLVGMLSQSDLLRLLGERLRASKDAPSEEKLNAATPSEQTRRQGPKRVLVIEDDTVTRRIVCHHLQRAGFEVRHSEDGGTASRLLEEETYDLIVTDINLPQVSGLCLLDSFNGRLSGTRKIVMSASHRDDMILQAFKLGADDFVKKPFNPDILMWRVQRLLTRA